MPFSCITISASHLSLFLLCGVEDGGAAHLGQFTSLSVEGPAADLVSYHVSDEEDAAVEAEWQPVEQLDVLQQVVVWVTADTRGELMKETTVVAYCTLLACLCIDGWWKRWLSHLV